MEMKKGIRGRDARWFRTDHGSVSGRRWVSLGAVLCFCLAAMLIGHEADASVFCPTQCNVNATAAKDKLYFMIHTPEKVHMTMQFSPNITPDGQLTAPLSTKQTTGQTDDWTLEFKDLQSDTLYYYKLKIRNSNGTDSHKYGAAWSNQLNVKFLLSHIYVQDDGESGCGEFSWGFRVENTPGDALIEVGDVPSTGKAVRVCSPHTLNVNKLGYFHNVKKKVLHLELHGVEWDDMYPDRCTSPFDLNLYGGGWSNGKIDLSFPCSLEGGPVWTGHVKAQIVWAGAQTNVPDLSHLDSKMTILPNAEVVQNFRKITVKSPNGGEQWNAGTIKTISWTALGPVGPVKVVLRKGDVPVQVLSPNEAPSMQGTFNWNIPWNLPSGDDYKIRVRTVDTNNVVRDDSDGAFSIKPKVGTYPGPARP